MATIDASGEGITLHRTDTVVFLEFDWVPAAMWQAEDRIMSWAAGGIVLLLVLFCLFTNGTFCLITQ